jgi:hypothetical protein
MLHVTLLIVLGSFCFTQAAQHRARSGTCRFAISSATSHRPSAVLNWHVIVSLTPAI